MSVGARLRIDKKTIHQSEALRQRPVVRRDVLRAGARRTRRFSRAEDRQARVAIGLGTGAGLPEIAENLVVGAILFDDIYHMLDRTGAGEQSGFDLADQSVVSQDLLREVVQPSLVRNVNQTQIA